MARMHNYDAAWKSILEAFEKEIVEILFPEIYNKIDWENGTESLDNELEEIQKEIFSKEENKKIISDKILKVNLKDKNSKILFIHVEVQSYSSINNQFGERMFRYFYRIWDRFRYKYNDNSEIVGSAIYTYSGTRGKDKGYTYKIDDLSEDILTYNFRTIDIETLDLGDVDEKNPLKLVFKMAKKLLSTGLKDNEVFLAKVELLKELTSYDKVKTMDQAKALAYFLEYLFLINDETLDNKFKEIKENQGGDIKMSIDEIREVYLVEKGIEQGIEQGIEKGIEEAIKKMLAKGMDEESISNILEVDIAVVNKCKER